MKSETIKIGGKKITLEIGEIAKQAHGSVVIKQGGTLVLVTVVAEEEKRETLDFFPLTVEYREKYAAVGKIPGGFIKRESRPQEHEILASRLIDRSVRPLFPEDFFYETQIMATVLSFDEDSEPEPLSILGASAALYLSDIPWNGPVGGIRLVRKNDRMILFPTLAQREDAEMELVISCSKEGLVMMEGMGKEVPEAFLIEAIELVQKSLKPFFNLLDKWKEELNVKKREYEKLEINEDLRKIVKEKTESLIKEALLQKTKQQRLKRLREIYKNIQEELKEKYTEEDLEKIPLILEELKHNIFREYLLKEQRRIDGRKFDEIRPISGKVGWLPRAHGSALFTRGETQAMVSCTLGTPEDEQIVETLYGESRQKFMLHYNFPPYSVGEVKPLRGPGRREIGHGFLATRALQNILPDDEEFPYTIRLVSDISESNGSSSMATVCGGSLALMDTGVPIKKPVAGIAMGLIKEKDKIMILSDIMGEEDHLGDMDFKVAGTEAGVTAVQMDNKIGSLSREILEKALEQAKKGRLHILNEMKKILAEPRKKLSPYAPKVTSLIIRKSRIRDLIGPGGKTIQDLQEEYNVKIDINFNTGRVLIYSIDTTYVKKVLEKIKYLTGEVEVGKYYRGEVIAVKDFGAFVRIFYNVEGLIHISEIANKRIDRVSDFLKEGDIVTVKVIGVDRQGKIQLSRKEALNVSELEIEN